ncbi:OPT/YSL family transporter [Stieleria sp. ICT_E10.1]|uniref:OPT family oligopeptide transporter n=1 Tax=Stieleria sedimenti TaxID=2976331 RepID=UPI002180963E|nr:OPT/YSL family transporter [Stieleria sedimenti]MCS7466921.1 OPT/YSL family transporter [Stieleria sedimenti]
MSDSDSQHAPQSIPSAEGSIPVRHGPYPEFTWTAVLVGWAIGALIAVSIGYAALILGFAIEGSELAAILGWGVLRGVMRRTSIVENNINQTIASAVNGASSGIMFSVPALFILSRTPGFESVANFNTPLMILACVTGCVLGLAFVIPLRKQMIDFDRLAYPGGIAVATILKSPGAGVRKAVLLLGGALLSGVAHLLVLAFMGEDHDWHAGSQFGLPAMLNISLYLSVMTIGVGYLSGKGGFWFGCGGFICYFLLSPLLSQFGSEGVAAMVSSPNEMRGVLYKPLGIGMLVGAAVGGIIAAFPLIASAFKSMHAAGQQMDAGVNAYNDEMPIRFLYSAIGIGLLVMVFIAFESVPEMTLGRAVAMAVLGTLWVWVAGVVVAECIGRTNWSPLSGMTLIAVTILILVAKGGLDSAATITSSMVVGAAICLAISQASDMMLDLKSGYLVGAIPRRQQYAQFVGAWLGPVIVISLMFLLNNQYQIGSDKLPAPQAQALASVTEGILNDNVPAYRYTAGAGLGLLLAMSGLGGIGVLIALGFYMPFQIALTYTIGNVLRIVSDKSLGTKFGHEVGIPIAAGLIVGEALVGVGNALYQVFFAAPEVAETAMLGCQHLSRWM